MSMLDVDTMPRRIEAWLEANVKPATVHGYTIMTGGFSRVMARVDLEWHDGPEESFVLRGDPPPEMATLETDRALEWRLLADLSEVGDIPMPRARWFIEDDGHLGTQAIFLDFIEGGSLQAAMDAGIDLPAAMDRFVDLMGTVSAVEASRVPSLTAPDSWDAHMDDRIGRWRAIAERHCEALPIVRYIGAWLDRRRPEPAPLRLVHGDFQQGNIMDTPTGWQMVDWEFARIGDPREDLGYYNAYASTVPPNLLDTDMDRFLEAFRQRTGLSESQVNPVTLGYFTVLATVSVVESLYDGIDAFAAGDRQGVAVAYNSQLSAVGSDNFINAIDQLEAAIAAAEGA